MTLLQKRKLKLTAKRIIRNDKKRKIYLLNLHWIKIKKQKLRRRKRTFIRLWKLERLNTLRRYGWVA
jgi:adenine-specific DNA methylase